MTSNTALSFAQFNLMVSNMEASVAFYRRLGLAVDEAKEPGWKKHHATMVMPNGVRFDLDSHAFAKQWGFDAMAPKPGGVVLFLSVPSRESVDRIHADMTAAGHRNRHAPEDAFWGSRYAILEDPDGHAIGLMSPSDSARRFKPPAPPA